jgi:hypothetical protein
VTLIKIRNKEYNIPLTKDSSTRRATQYTNQIYEQLRLLGIPKDDVSISEERLVIKRAPANASWWFEDFHCHFSYNKMNKFVDNLLVVLKVIESHVQELINQEISFEEFVDLFKEDNDVVEQQEQAREFFGLEKNHVDLETINKKYKILAKELHPDMPGGDLIKFKELNKHHKTLKRELE